jgi:hypothetical protein
MRQIILFLGLIFIANSCIFKRTDDFDKVKRISFCDKSLLKIGEEFILTLSLTNEENGTKELTIYEDLNKSLILFDFWYCDSEMQKSIEPTKLDESGNRESYLVKLKKGESIGFTLLGKLDLVNDTLQLSFKNYNKIFKYPYKLCDNKLEVEIHGKWFPGRPYLADSFEYGVIGSKMIILKN